jgi:hypothetical protein
MVRALQKRERRVFSRQRLPSRLPVEQLHEIPGALVWRKERDDDLPRATAFAPQFVFDLQQKESVPEVRPQLR